MNRLRALLRSGRLRRAALRTGVAGRDVDDVVQDALQRLWEKRDPSGTLPAGAGRFVINQAREHLRSTRVRTEVLMPFDDDHELGAEGMTPEAVAILRAGLALLKYLIDQIPAERRELFIQHELHGKSLAEIAAETGIPRTTAKERLRAAREDLERAKLRWQAEQRRRGRDDRPLVALPPLDRRAWSSRPRWVRRQLGAGVLAGAVALVAILGFPITASQLCVAPGVATALTLPPAASVRAAAPARSDSLTESEADDRSAAPAPTVDGAPAEARQRTGWSPSEDILIGRAHAALGEGDVVEAQRLLDQHARRFPRGQLKAKRDELLRSVR